MNNIIVIIIIFLAFAFISVLFINNNKFDSNTFCYLFTGIFLVELLLYNSLGRKINLNTYLSLLVSSLILISLIETVYFWKPLTYNDDDDPEGGQGKRYEDFIDLLKKSYKKAPEISNSVVEEPIEILN